MRALILSVLVMLAAPAALATECRQDRFDGVEFSICEVDLTREDLRLFLRDEAGNILGNFSRVEGSLESGQRLGFAVNAGMFHDDRGPVGLYIEDGQQEMRIVTSDGPGNFGLLPNGVFCIQAGRAQVIESRSYAANPPDCRYATQSGPMLVIDGALHPRFLPDSTSLNIRNGVGVDATGTRAIFAISGQGGEFRPFRAALPRSSWHAQCALPGWAGVAALCAGSGPETISGSNLAPFWGRLLTRRASPASSIAFLGRITRRPKAWGASARDATFTAGW